MSMRIRNSFERGARPYQVLAELIPASTADYDCGVHNITIARISPYSRQVRFGVRSRRYEWSGAKTADYTPLANAYNVAVEVGPKASSDTVDCRKVQTVLSLLNDAECQ